MHMLHAHVHAHAHEHVNVNERVSARCGTKAQMYVSHCGSIGAPEHRDLEENVRPRRRKRLHPLPKQPAAVLQVLQPWRAHVVDDDRHGWVARRERGALLELVRVELHVEGEAHARQLRIARPPRRQVEELAQPVGAVAWPVGVHVEHLAHATHLGVGGQPLQHGGHFRVLQACRSRLEVLPSAQAILASQLEVLVDLGLHPLRLPQAQRRELLRRQALEAAADGLDVHATC